MLEFSPSRSGEILHRFFPRSWCGEVQTNGAKMYPGVFKYCLAIVHFECIALLCRYVLEAVKAGEQAALPLLKEITRLYRIERQATARGIECRSARLPAVRKVKPILKQLQPQFRAIERDMPLFGKLREAVVYANQRWRNPARYARIECGHILID